MAKRKRQRIDTLIDFHVYEARKRKSETMTKLTNEMLAILEWASNHSKDCHDIGPLPASKQAAELLAKRGVIEIRQPMNQYRLKPEAPQK